MNRFKRTAVNILTRGACKARKSVIIDPCICLPDSNSLFRYVIANSTNAYYHKSMIAKVFKAI